LKLYCALFIGIGVLVFPNASLHAQEKLLELLPGAESITMDMAQGKQTLVGNVRFSYQGNLMYCDSAIYFFNKKHVYAYGKVHLNSRDTLNLFCDSLFYNDNNNIAKLWSNVRIRDRYYRIDTDSLEFHTKKETMTYRHGAVITNLSKNEKLTSRTGTYSRKTEVFNFGRDVVFKDDRYNIETDTMRYKTRTEELNFYGKTRIHQLSDSTIIYCQKGYFDTKNNKGTFEGNAKIFKPDQHLYGDKLIYNGATESAIGEGHVRLIDFKEQVEIFCGRAVSDGENKYKQATINPKFFSFKDADTSYLLADTIYIQLDSLDEVLFIKAHYNVRYASKDYRAICDSLVNNKQDSLTQMFGSPILWNENTQMTGEYMKVVQDSSHIKTARVEGKALSISEVEPETYYNQVSGRDMTGFFNEGKLHLVHVVGNAKTIYFLEDEKENDSTVVVEHQGMTRLVSSELKVYLDSGEVQRVTYIGEPDGVYYDMNKAPEKEMKSEFFNWQPEKKPELPIPLYKEQLFLFENRKLEINTP
jgi:lipopolysaccharide export system protein LptA